MNGLSDWYLWLKAGHVISLIAWMAGMFYLPRLYVYHCQVQPDTAESARFIIMERRLLRAIINPAMISTLFFGLLLAATPGVVNWHAGWWYVKIACLAGLFGFHGLCARWRRSFAENRNVHSEKFYRMANEIPTVLMVIIVIMVIVKPF
ncbi:protoporphyrinogen oxidase HemJ [Acetobacter sp. AN02]|uniref:protoporphyrinogen oxidase HemJ n=1 Tax=Acetobacter sp. AN02 TaxID=2894186 RepID=UPI0024342D30|nr:protoporphyrinogen oxidase HemJ [Acetobacter sp. AN02]MDG6094267.1 protoporphyrinogen oxidase HemJ [Acetobacter sp. AN02]